MSHHHPDPPPTDAETKGPDALGMSSTALMVAGVAGGYGLLAWLAARFMLPATVGAMQELFVTRVGDVAVGASLL